LLIFSREWGYEQKDFLDPGSDKPGINLVKGEDEIEIYLDILLDENSKSEIEIVFKRQSIKIRTPKMTDECRMLLSEALKIYEHNNHSPAAV
jgi:hypothetical protein